MGPLRLERLLTVVAQIFQYGGIQGRLDSVPVYLIAEEPQEGCPDYAAEAGGFHGRRRRGRC